MDMNKHLEALSTIGSWHLVDEMIEKQMLHSKLTLKYD